MRLVTANTPPVIPAPPGREDPRETTSITFMFSDFEAQALLKVMGGTNQRMASRAWREAVNKCSGVNPATDDQCAVAGTLSYELYNTLYNVLAKDEWR